MNKEKLFNFIKKIDQIHPQENASTPKIKKADISNLIFMPIGLLLRNYKTFFIIGSIFVVFMTVLSFATGNSLVCSTSSAAENNPFRCPEITFATYTTFFLLRLLIIATFLKSWYLITTKNHRVDFSNLFIIDWKLFTVLVIFIIINILPLVSFVMLANRVPNPDWLIETCYFAVMCIGFVLPFVAIRFYGIPAFIASQTPVPSFKQYIKNTADNGLRLLFSISALVLFCALVMTYFAGISEKMLAYNQPIFGVLAEIIYNFLFLAVTAILMNYSYVQKKELFDDQINREA